jgi:threonine aldolase
MAQTLVVHFDADSDDPSPVEYSRRLAAAAARAGDAADKYGEGDLIATAERLIARRLGKERAVLFATGTMANMLALDRLCPRFARRVLVHPDSHIFSDTGDGAAASMGLTLLTLPADGPGFTAQAALQAIQSARMGKVRQGVGAVVVETPVRRYSNAMFPLAELDRVAAQVRAQGVALHLDGARLPIAAASAARSIEAFAAPFDSVYLSLWKMLGLPFGAALAGSATLLEGAEHDRRRMGGTLPQLWPLAVMVLAHLDERLGSWPQVFAHFDAFRAVLARQGRFTLSPIGTEATNTVWLDVGPLDPARLRACARQQGLVLPEPQGNRFAIRANVGWLPHAPQDLLARLGLAADDCAR